MDLLSFNTEFKGLMIPISLFLLMLNPRLRIYKCHRLHQVNQFYLNNNHNLVWIHRFNQDSNYNLDKIHNSEECLVNRL